jgi:predicted lipid-binding transport protein (Tim44 family)
MINVLKHKKAILLLFIFTLSVCLLYARGGGGIGSGGGGGRGGGGYFFGAVWLIFTVWLAVVLYLRKKAARKVIAKAKEDIWNMHYLEQTTEKVFLAFQQAWMDRDLSSVSKMVTYNLYLTHHPELQHMKAKGEKNILEKISVDSIRIIGCKDYLDNAKDSFSAYIKGTMVDYTINEINSKVIDGSDSESKKFSDLYVFTRDGNTWLLNQVINDPQVFEILEVKNISEENQKAADVGLATA